MRVRAAALVSGAVPAAMMAAVLQLLAAGAGAGGDDGDWRLTVGLSAGRWSFERQASERVALGVAGYGLRVIKSDWRGDGGGEEVVARKGGGG
jgi:hypothetical protein